MDESKFEYDIALSFAGENRNIVEPIADALRKSGVRVFYDKFKKADLWGRNLFDYLHELYSKRTKYVALFISKSYIENDWTRLERQASQSKALKLKEPFILPVMLEKVEVPGLTDTVAFLDYKEEGQEGIIQLICEKLSIPSPPHPGKTINFVGRVEEIEIFKSLLNNDNIKGLWLHGPGGIGKSALIRQFCQIARCANYIIFGDKDRIGNESPVHFIIRVFEFEKERIQSLETPNIEGEILSRLIKELTKDSIIVIDASRDFENYKGLADFLESLIGRLENLENRIFLLIATRRLPVDECKPSYIKLRQLTGLNVNEIREFIKLKGGDEKLMGYAEILKEKTGGWPIALEVICMDL